MCATFISTGIVTDVERMGRISKLLVSALENFSSRRDELSYDRELIDSRRIGNCLNRRSERTQLKRADDGQNGGLLCMGGTSDSKL